MTPEDPIVALIERSDRQRRVVIWRMPEGAFRFAEEARYDVSPLADAGGDPQRWARLAAEGSLCGTAAEAEREARATIEWLGNGDVASSDERLLL